MIGTPTPEEMLGRGWSVIPVRITKKPAIDSWKPFQRECPSVEQISEWRRTLRPIGWAVVTGKVSDVFVLDFDGGTGNATRQKLGLHPHVQTGSGGHHVYVRYPGFKVSTVSAKTKREMAALFPGMDVRGDGGYAVAAGRNKAGEYRWLRSPDPDSFESLPSELTAFLRQCGKNAEGNATHSTGHTKAQSDARVPAEKLIRDALQQASASGRNDAGFWLAVQLRDHNYSESEAREIILDYAARVPSANGKGQAEAYTQREAVASVCQAYTRPAREPWKSKRKHHTSKNDDTKKSGRNFDAKDSGVFYVDSHPDREPLRICSRMDILKETRDDRGEGWGRLLRWKDREGREHRWAMPMSLLAGSGDEYRGRLLDGGLEIEPGKQARDLLTIYIQTARCDGQARCVAKLGWYGDVFVLPDGAIGGQPEGEQYIYQSPLDADHYFNVRGTTDDWKREVGVLCAGNSRLIFAVCLAFAAPLLLLSETESGGFHLWGPSSLGKSTALLVAGSVCGGGGRNGYVESWRTTSNALEAFAELHNDTLACLDEIAQVSAVDAAEVLYMLANGQGKGRMSKVIAMRRRLSWTILILSSGEITLREHAETAGKQTKAGTEIRLANIPADAGVGLGLFENLHSFPSASVFANHLKEASKKFFGAPIRDYLKCITEDRRGVETAIRKAISRFLDDQVICGGSPEVLRVARRFALAAAAGQVATGLGLTGWRDGEANRGIDRCFKAWLRARGSTGPADRDAAVDRVAAFIEAHGASRFQSDSEDKEKEKVVNRAGFLQRDRDGNVELYLILPEVFRTEVCKGYDSEMVARTLFDRGFLEPSGKGRLQKKPRIRGLGTVWVYAVRPSILGREITTGDSGDSGDEAHNP